jgi:hypothetical protein
MGGNTGFGEVAIAAVPLVFLHPCGDLPTASANVSIGRDGVTGTGADIIDCLTGRLSAFVFATEDFSKFGA